jgi:hypothetical protein
MKYINKFFIGISALTGAIAAFTKVSVVLAQAKSAPVIATKSSDLEKIFCSIIGWFFWIIIIISVIMVLLAAYDYVTAGDDTEKTERGRKRITYAAIGIGVALLALGFPQIVASVFPNASGLVLFNCSGA